MFCWVLNMFSWLIWSYYDCVGVQMYSSVADQKLRDHSENGFRRWKYSVESSLNRYGFGSIENLVNQFQATSIQEKSRSSIPNEQKAKLDQHFQYFSKVLCPLIFCFSFYRCYSFCFAKRLWLSSPCHHL